MKKLFLLFFCISQFISRAQLNDIKILVPKELGYTYYDLMQFLPDEKFFVIASNALSVYNTETSEIIDETELQYGARNLSINNQGNLFAIAVSNELLLYSFNEQKLALKEKIKTADLLKDLPNAQYYTALPIGSAFFTGTPNQVYAHIGAFSIVYDYEKKQVVRSHAFALTEYIVHSALHSQKQEAILAVSSGTNCAILRQSLSNPASTSTIMVSNGTISKMNIRDSLLFCFATDKYFVLDLSANKVIHEIRMPRYDYTMYGYDKNTLNEINKRISITKPDTINFSSDEYVYDIDLLRSKKQLVYATSKGLKFIDPVSRKTIQYSRNIGTNLKLSKSGKRLIFNSYLPYKALRIYDPNGLQLVSERPSLGNPVSFTNMSPDKRWLYTNGSTTGFLWDLHNLTKYAEIKDPSNSDSSYVANVFFLNDSEVVVNSGKDFKHLNLALYDIRKKQFKKILKQNVYSLASGFKDDEFYYCDYNSLHIINLKTLAEEKYTGVFSLAASPMYNIISFTKELVFIPETSKFKIVNRKTKKTEYESEAWSVNARVMINADNKSVLTFSQIKKKKKFNGYETEIPTNALVKIDLQKKEIVKDYAETYFPYDFKIKGNGKTLGTWYLKNDLTNYTDKQVVYTEYDLDSGEELFTKSLSTGTNIVSYHFTSDNGKYFVLAEPMAAFFKVFNENGELIMDLSDAGIQIPKCFISETSDLLIITSSINSQATFVDLKQRKIMGQLFNASGDNFFMITPELNYIGSKEFVKALRFKHGSEVFSFEQFDVHLNQPHKVLTAFNCKDTALMQAYETAYQKRLKVLGVSKGYKLDFTKSPSIQNVLLTEEKPGFVKFSISANKGNTKLKSVEIFNNGNLIHYSGIGEQESARFDKTFEFETSSGINRFEFVVKDDAGLESPHITRFYNNTSQVKPDLYLVVIASEKFANSDFNLAYAVKDAGDVAATMVNSKSFKNVHVKKIFNQSFHADSIKQLNTFFGKAGINDVVMVFFAGHGYLDEDFSYYFPTYYTDFNDPKINSVAYTSFEKLFTGMKPTRKLMFIDACFSGEADKENQFENGNDTQDRKDSTRAIRLAGSSFAQSTALEMSKAIFSDLRQNTGATIISSAGGTEAAFEGEKWNNGLFTHCLIKGLKSLRADENKDAKIMLSELQKFVSEEVYKLSEGKQTPTYRVENVVLDYELW